MILYLNQYGVITGIKKMVKVVLYVAASGAVAALTAKLNEYQVSAGQVYAVAAVAAANAGLAFATGYLKTNEKDFALPSIGKKKVVPVSEDTSPLVAN
jgi:hypothetical protein